MKVDIFNTEKKYDIIYADPPWEYRNMGNIQATAASHYPTMKQADIEKLPVGGGLQRITRYCLCGRRFRN